MPRPRRSRDDTPPKRSNSQPGRARPSAPGGRYGQGAPRVRKPPGRGKATCRARAVKPRPSRPTPPAPEGRRQAYPLPAPGGVFRSVRRLDGTRATLIKSGKECIPDTEEAPHRDTVQGAWKRGGEGTRPDKPGGLLPSGGGSCRTSRTPAGSRSRPPSWRRRRYCRSWWPGRPAPPRLHRADRGRQALLPIGHDIHPFSSRATHDAAAAHGPGSPNDHLTPPSRGPQWQIHRTRWVESPRMGYTGSCQVAPSPVCVIKSGKQSFSRRCHMTGILVSLFYQAAGRHSI